jgi:hypothetical protein
MDFNKGFLIENGRFFFTRLVLVIIASILQSCSRTPVGSPATVVYQFTPTSKPIIATPTITPNITPTFSDDYEIDNADESLIAINSLPSGSYLVYCSFNELDEDYGNSLFVMDTEGDGYGRLADDACRSGISLDYRLLVFDRRDWSRMEDYLVILELEYGNEKVVPSSLDCSEGSFGPSNDRIVTSCHNNIFVIDLISGDKRMIDDCESRGGCSGRKRISVLENVLSAHNERYNHGLEFLSGKETVISPYPNNLE